MSDAANWLSSIRTELDNMRTNNVWHDEVIDIATVPKHLILSSQLIVDLKHNPDGTYQKHKCRLVIRGDKWYDVYNMNKYASTVKS